MAPTIRNEIILPSGDIEVVRAPVNMKFTDSHGHRYNPAGRNHIKRRAVMWGMWWVRVAEYVDNNPNAKPIFYGVSPGLTGKDLSDIEGDWLVGLLRRALASLMKMQPKDYILLFLSGGALVVGVYCAWKIRQLANYWGV